MEVRKEKDMEVRKEKELYIWRFIKKKSPTFYQRALHSMHLVEYRALLVGCWDLLVECRALSIEYTCNQKGPEHRGVEDFW